MIKLESGQNKWLGKKESNEIHKALIEYQELYLDHKVIKTVSQIPLKDRASFGFEEVGKKPLREIAKKMEVPDE